MEGAICSLVVIAFIAIIGVNLWWGSQAKQTDETVVPIGQDRAADAVDRAFNGLLWKDVDGPGHINKRRRALRDAGPTVSVVLEPAVNGGTQVSTWMSAWVAQFGIPNFAFAAVRQKKRVLQRTEAAVNQPQG